MQCKVCYFGNKYVINVGHFIVSTVVDMRKDSVAIKTNATKTKVNAFSMELVKYYQPLLSLNEVY